VTATIHHIAREFKIDEGQIKYMIQLIDAKGNVCHTAKGINRDFCIIGLQDCGFIVSDETPPNSEYREYLKSTEPKLV